MACFSLVWLQQFLIWFVIVIAAVAIVNIVVPWLLAQLGSQPDGGKVLQVLRIIVWAFVAIYLIYLVFDLLTCAFGGGLRLGGVR